MDIDDTPPDIPSDVLDAYGHVPPIAPPQAMDMSPHTSDMQDLDPHAPDWIRGLNDAQKQAVMSIDGAYLVLAGAGTGKTRVLTTRIAQILYLRRAAPYQILCVTFTNKAAAEMRHRVEKLTGQLSGIWLGTFHNLCLRILRKHAGLVGLQSAFTILDDADQVRILKDILLDLGVDKDKYPAKNMIAHIQRWKDKALPPDAVSLDMVGNLANGHLQQAYVRYQQRLQQLNAVDFGDLILYVVQIFQNHPDILSTYQQRFQYILVDEYQDTNTAQYKWLCLLSHRYDTHGTMRANICCVGDDDQSIYGWRGADVENILRFEADFPNATVIRLEQNYRSTAHILNTANALIAHNKHRLGKNLYTDIGDGQKVRISAAYDGDAEAVQVSQIIENAQAKGEKYADMAVLVRAGYQTLAFERRFFEINMPYKVIGGAKFYEREEIRDVVAYLRVVYQKQDDLAFDRIINKPARGIGKATVQALHTLSRAKGICLYDCALHIVQGDDLPKRAKTALQNAIDSFAKWRKMAGDTETENAHIHTLKTLLDDSGYMAYWQQSKHPKAPSRVDNIRELSSAMQSFQNLGGYLEHIALHMDADDVSTDDSVSIMTLHAAKGLEFDRVFLVGWEDGLFPSERSLDELGDKGLEEERRLAYVGITRAKKYCHISFATSRLVHGSWTNNEPSRFLQCLPNDSVDIQHMPRFNGYNNGYSDTDSSPQICVMSAQDDGESGFAINERCFHQKFGMGTVQAVDGDYVTIAFDHAGIKKVMATFVESV